MFIFGINIQELEDEWREQGMKPSYDSVENDIMVQQWDELFDPAIEFKKEGVYEKFKNLVHSRTVSGTFYRKLDDEHLEHLQPGDMIDYRSRLTSWFVKVHMYDNEDSYVVKITCENAPGLEVIDMGKISGIILGECQLKVVSRNGKLIEVCI